MKFSIVVPAYNCESLVGECIESVLEQSYADLELIVVDDGSTDGTLDVCTVYASGDSRIKVVHKKNGGPFSARLAAYPKVTGDYVLHVDADDRLKWNALQSLYSIVRRDKYDVVFFEFSSRPDFTNMVKRFPFSCSRSFEYSERSLYLNLALDSFCLHSMCSKAVRTQLLLSASYPVEAFHLISGEDHLQSLILLDQAKNAYYLMEALYYYRENPGSTTRSFRFDDYRDFMIKIQYFKRLLSEWKTIPGSKITDDQFDSYVLVSSYRYLESAAKYGNKYDYNRALDLVSSFDIFARAINNPTAVHKQRIDMKIALRLLSANRKDLAKLPISFVAGISMMRDSLKARLQGNTDG